MALAAVFCVAQALSALAQSEGDIRLRNGSDATEGRVEVYLESEWGTVCDDDWDLTDAAVACRQLGYLGASAALVQAAFGAGRGPIHLSEVACDGTESRLVDCPYGESYCSHIEDAGVACDTSSSGTVTPASVSVTEGDAVGGQYLVVLDAAPLGDVVVSVSGTADTDVTADPTTLTFTDSNWNQLQTVAVTATDDADTANDTATLTHGASGGGYDSAQIPSVQVTVVDDDGTNNSPVFDDGAATSRSVAENAGPGSSVGAPVAATDGDGETPTYSLLGMDAGHFTIDTTNGQIRTRGALDHEATPVYRVSVKAEDTSGASDTINVTVAVRDVDEPPTAPAAPTLVVATRTSLKVRWTAPNNAGRPPIESYDLQYRAAESSDFAAGPQDVAGTRATISELIVDTQYFVQVRATNDEGDGAWSASLDTRTGLPISSDADLASLNVRHGGAEVPLAPTFSADVTSYTAEVEASASLVTVRAEANYDRATVAYDPPDADTGTADTQMALVIGSNSMTITVTAEDGTTQDYGLLVKRPKSCTATTTAVTLVTSNPSAGLISDCNILLEAREHLLGEESDDPPSLNWATNVSMNDWHGVKVESDRVTELNTWHGNGGTFYSHSLENGELPGSLGMLTELKVLRFNNVGLRGVIPPEIGDLSKLRKLHVSATQSALSGNEGVHGPIPASLGNLTMLTTLNLESNSLGGPIPDSLRRLTSLEKLELTDNVRMSVFQQPLDLTSGFEGAIPSWFGELPNLTTLELGFSRLTGRIPRYLGELTQLTSLVLEENFLTGCIPGSLKRFRGNIAKQRNTNNVHFRYLPNCPAPNRVQVTVDSVFHGRIAATYSASVRSGGQPVTHLEYRLSTDGGTTWSPDWTTIPDSGPGEANAGSYAFEGLRNGTTYTLEIRAVNIDGNGSAAQVTATPREPSSDATLAGLTVHDGSADAAVNPTFAPTTTSYTAMVGQSSPTVTVIATPTDANAMVVPAPADEDGGTDGFQISVVTGFNDIQLTVTAEDSTEMAYGLTVIRNPGDDPAGVEIDSTELSVDEGETGSYTVVLAAEPVAAVTVGVVVASDHGVAASPKQLTFGTTDWATAQTVQVTTVADPDAVNGSAVLTHAASGAGYEWVDIEAVAVTVTDHDVDGVTLSLDSLTITEGRSEVYTVVLDTRPTAPVTVRASAPSGSDVGVSPATLTFTTLDWATARNLTVTTQADDDAEDDQATLTHTASGGGYGDVAVASVPVTVVDDDTKGVTLSAQMLQLDEQGAGDVYTVVLDTQPTGPVTVTANAPSGSDLAIDPEALTFAPGDWRTARSVTVTAGADDDPDDDEDAITHTATGGGYGTVAVANVQVSVADDDVAGVVFSTLALGVIEDDTATYSVRLGGMPRATVTLTTSVPDDSKVSLHPSELVFTTGTWETAQTVTVTAADDADDMDEEVSVRHAATGGNYDGASINVVVVTVTDDDTAGVALSATAVTVDEGDASAYTVRLVTRPGGAVTLTPGVSGDGVAASPAALTFTDSDWHAFQTITVAAAHDDDAGDGEATVSHTLAGGGYDSVDVADVQITVRDDDVAGVTLSRVSLAVDEGASTAYTIVLDTRPVQPPVTVTVEASTGGIGANPASLGFDAVNWRTAQTVTVSAEHDDDAEDDGGTVTHTVSGGDYAGLAVDRVDVRVIDDDVAGVSLSTSVVTVGEGATASYTVALDTEPTGEVTVAVDAPAGSDLRANPGSLAFDAGNWRTRQTVILRATDDPDTDSERVVVSHAASGADYGSVAVVGLTVNVVDDDTPSVGLSATMLALDEGGSATYTVHLGTEPTAPVIVTPTVASATGVAVSPTSLTFAVADWRMSHTVTVTAAQDDDTDDVAATVDHAVRGGGYDGIRVASVAVRVRDDDRSLVLTGARADGNRVTLVFDQPLDPSRVPATGDFHAQVDRATGSTDIDVVAVVVQADTVTLTLARALQGGDRITVKHTPGVNPIRTQAGIPAAAFTVSVAWRGVASTLRVLLFESAASPDRQGFVRIINHSAEAGEVAVEAVDDSGMRVGPVILAIDAWATAHFNSDDLEAGNADKGLAEGVGQASFGNWRLELTSNLDIEVLSYARTSDGFVTSLHDALPVDAGVHRSVVFFNPAENVNQESRLRLVNAGTTDATVTVTATDDLGDASAQMRVTVATGMAVDLTASELESGTGRGIDEGALGQGEGKWRLRMTSDSPVIAMSLLESRGRLTNLSTAPRTAGIQEGSFAVLLFPSASDPELQGFVRVINRSERSGSVRIVAFDDTDITYETVTMSVGPGEVGSFNSDDLELGNPDKGLTGSTGAGRGDWRLELSSELDIEVLAYIRTNDGFVTAMHDLAPVVEGVHRVVFLNPASNTNQVSRIRIVNPGEADAAVTITGTDGTGTSPGEPVRATVPAGTSLELTSEELETGLGEGIDGGALGDGHAKWLLEIESDRPIHVMSLLRSPTGHLTNLSTSPDWSASLVSDPSRAHPNP